MESLGLGSGGKAMLLFGEAHHVQARAMGMLHAVLACVPHAVVVVVVVVVACMPHAAVCNPRAMCISSEQSV